MTRAEMLESLRKCAGCGHTRSSHPGGHRCRGAECVRDFLVPCVCAEYRPGELSAEGKRMESGR